MKRLADWRLRTACSATAATVLLTGATAAFAVGGGGHGGEDGHGAAAWWTLLFSAINFSIFVFLLYRYAWPAIRDFLSTRHREVTEAMEAAEKARAEADRIRTEYEAKEKALEKTRARLLEEIQAGAEADRQKVLQEAEETAARLRADAERQAENDLARARRELRAEAARLARDLAEKEVRSRLTDADRSRLVHEFVEGVSRQ